MKEKYLIYYCGFLIGFSAFSIDIMLPSFEDMRTDLGTSMELAQMNITIYIFAFGLGQIFFGPLSDRVGRKPALYIGIVLYILGAFTALVAPTIEIVLAGRVLQGFGGASCQSVGRAIIRDCYSGMQLARNMSIAMAIFAFGPIFAPFLGYGLTQVGGWQLVFTGMLTFGVIILAVTPKIPETLKNANPRALKPNHMWNASIRVLSNRQSLYFLIVSAVLMSSMLSFVTNAARLYEALDIRGLAFAAGFAFIGSGIIAGQFINQSMLTKLGQTRSMVVSTNWMASCMCLMIIFIHFGLLNFWWFTAFMFVFGTFFLICYANSLSLVIDPHGDIAGFTSSFYGFFVQVFSSTLVSLLTLAFQGLPLYWSLYMCFVTAIVLLLIRHWHMTKDDAPGVLALTPETTSKETASEETDRQY